MRSHAARLCRQRAASRRAAVPHPNSSLSTQLSGLRLLSTSSPAQFPRGPPKRAAFVVGSSETGGGSDVQPGASDPEQYWPPMPVPTRIGGSPPSDPSDGKPKRRPVRTIPSTTQSERDAQSSAQLPISPATCSEILWVNEDGASAQAEGSSPAGGSSSPTIPPAYMLDDALTNLYVTFNPHVQANACSGSSPEPTLALYCPIEGGHGIIDETVKVLAQQVGADVVVLDAVELAAGQFGQFGKAASAFRFSPNPLQQARAQSQPLGQQAPASEEDNPPFYVNPSVSISIPAGLRISSVLRPNRPSTSQSSPNSPGSRTKSFFDELVNIPSPPSAPESADVQPSSNIRRPRIIYIRDFQVLSEEASLWYPALLSAVRSRRMGPLRGSNGPVTSPTTIVFGISPALYESASQSASQSPLASGGAPALLGLLLGGQKPPIQRRPGSESAAKASGKGASEEDKLRERRLKERLRKWGTGSDEALRDLLPEFEHSPSSSANGSGAASITGLPQELSSLFGGQIPIRRVSLRQTGPEDDAEDAEYDGYWRVSGLVPAERDPVLEKQMRMDRRTRINHLLIRMRLGAVGAVLEDGDAAAETLEWPEKWGKKILFEDEVRFVVDRAVAKAIHEAGRRTTSTLDAISVPWSFVLEAWEAGAWRNAERNNWIEATFSKTARPASDALVQEDGAPSESAVDTESDEIIERVRSDPSLSAHEQRLLSCIIDPASMPTTFASVHLPDKTIDAIRTMVSLPLMYPKAFEEGLLKTHSMTGALLLGPPGVGKTLLARAVAKESGARMLVVKPSDVMDMYVGEGEKLVKSVFSLARRLSPCVIFLDEVDALFASRVSSRESGGTAAHRGIITEFMQEMDGLKTNRGDGNVIVIGATNRPFDLDDAVLRRLPRRLLVDLPGENERREILKILLRDETLAPDVDLSSLAKRTEMFSGSDLKHLCIAAVLDAVKETVHLPWRKVKSAQSSEDTVPSVVEANESSEPPSSVEGDTPQPLTKPRAISDRHFTKALSEITPSSSESLGTLSELRKWNEEFGEGKTPGKGKKRRWGGGRFGFGGKEGKDQDGRVVPNDSAAPAHVVTPLDRTSNYKDSQSKLDRQTANDHLAKSTTLYIGNLSFYTTEEQIYELFSKCASPEEGGGVKRIIMGLDRNTRTPCGFCFVEYYTHAEALASLRYISGTKLDERIVRCDLDLGYKEGRQFGRGKSGGQVRDEHRQDYDAGRGGWGAQAQREQERRKEREELYADSQDGPGAIAGGGEDWKQSAQAPQNGALKRGRDDEDDEEEEDRVFVRTKAEDSEP